MRTRRLAIALSLLITPAVAYAQQPSSDSMPHAGTWAAEAFLGNAGTGASILRFRSTNVVLLFGADLSYSHIADDDGTIEVRSGANTNVAARVGLRNLRGSSTDRLR